MSKDRLSKKQIALRALSLIVLIIAWIASTATSFEVPKEGYILDVESETGLNAFEVEETGYCLPVIRLEQPVHSLTIYAGDEIVAWAACEDAEDLLTSFYYNRSGECGVLEKFFIDDDAGQIDDMEGGVENGEDSFPPLFDAGLLPDAGRLPFDLACTCAVNDELRVGDEESEACIGTFRVEVETVTGDKSAITYEQEWQDESETGGCGG